MGLMRPGGIVRPNMLARRRGLSFALDFSDPAAEPWIRGGGGAIVGAAFNASGVRGANRSGWALTGANGYWGTGTGVGSTYSINPTEGTLLVFTRPDFISSDATASRMAFSMANNYPTGPGIEWLKHTDGNCYVGKIDAGDKRVTFSNSGLWAAGDDVVLGYTWAATGQIAYVNGRNVGSNASTGSSVTSGQPFNIGQLTTSSWYWNQTSDGAIYYALVFDAALTDEDMARAALNPWWWVETVGKRTPRIAVSGASITGTTSVTLAATTVVATGALAISGTTAVTLAATTVVATGTLAISGTASATLGNVTAAATATLALAGSTSATLGSITSAATGALAITGALGVTLDAITLAAMGSGAGTGYLSATLGAVTLSATATIALRASTSTTLADAIVAATGALQLRATSSVTLANSTLYATGTNANVTNVIVLVWNGVRI